jgi:TolB-like protein
MEKAIPSHNGVALMGGRISAFMGELKRRKVYRVAVVYAVVGFGLAQGAEYVFGILEFPHAAAQFVAILFVLGFPLALVLAWAYEVKPEARLADPAPAESTSLTRTSLDQLGWDRDEVESIVVLPFENLSPDPENAYFADGLTEEVIADLSAVKALRTISRTSALAYRGSAKTVPVIARELGVRFVLEGSVRREREDLRITAQLIDARSDGHLWAEKYTGTMTEVFDLQEQLSRRIVEALKVTLSPEEHERLSARPIPDVQAHDIWLRARQHALSLTVHGVQRAQDLVSQALALRPDNALLHATSAWVHAVRWGQVEEGADQELRLARQHAVTALELDPGLPWARFAMAIVHLREADLPGFVRWGTKALEGERDSHTLAILSLYLAYAGRIEAAHRYAAEAELLDPLSWLTAHAHAHAELYGGKPTAAFERMRDLVGRLAPGEAWPTYLVGYAALQAGLDRKARSWLQRATDGGDNLYCHVSRLMIHTLDNEIDEGLEVLARTPVATLAARFGVGSYWLGSCLAKLGKTDSAFEWLERSVEQWFTNHDFMRKDPLLAHLRESARFQALLEKAREKEAGLVV